MMLEECGPYLAQTIERAAVESEFAADESVEEVIAATAEAFHRLKDCLGEGKIPVTWTRRGEEASFVASIALKHVREKCVLITDNAHRFGAGARAFSLTFQRVDEAVREERCGRDVLLQKWEKPPTNQALLDAMER